MCVDAHEGQKRVSLLPGVGSASSCKLHDVGSGIQT